MAWQDDMKSMVETTCADVMKNTCTFVFEGVNDGVWSYSAQMKGSVWVNTKTQVNLPSHWRDAGRQMIANLIKLRINESLKSQGL